MNRFIKMALLGTLVFTLLWMAVEWYQPLVINKFSYKAKYMDNNAEKIKTLILGNSYMENSINPHLLGDSVFDLAVSARWIYYDDQLLARYIPTMSNLKYVIFGMGYAEPFYRSFNCPEEDVVVSGYQEYMHRKFMDIPYEGEMAHWVGLFEGYINIESLFDEKIQDSMGCNLKIGQVEGWEHYYNIDPDVIHNPDAEAQIEEYMGYLRDMARLCYEHNVRFIVVTPPYSNPYIVNVRQEGIDVLHGMIERIRSEYPVDYKDYIRDEQFRADSIYYNSSHLNDVGASMFALRVKEDFGL